MFLFLLGLHVITARVLVITAHVLVRLHKVQESSECSQDDADGHETRTVALVFITIFAFLSSILS